MIKFIRKSLWFKTFALFLAITILNLACNQPEIMSVKTQDNKLEYRNSVQIPDGANVARDFELSYELVNSVYNSSEVNSFQDLRQEFFEDNEFTRSIETEVNNYSNFGFDNYLNNIVERDIVSNEFKNEMINFKQELTNFIYDNHPNKEEFISFITNKKNVIIQSSLSEETIKNSVFYLDLIQGHANYLYKQYAISNGELEIRHDCNFWEDLLCVSLSLIVGVAITVLVAILIWYGLVKISGNVVVTTQDGPPNDFGGSGPQTISGDDAILVTGILIGVAIGVKTGKAFYDWCCDWFSDDSEQDCLDPSGYYYQKIDCNKFKYTIYGPSDYGATNWDNINTIPSHSITPYPTLVFSVEQPGIESIINADITCKENNSSIIIYEYGPKTELFEIDEDVFNLEWIVAPPENFDLEGNNPQSNLFEVRLNTPNGVDHYIYSWSITQPHSIYSDGGSNNNYATLKFHEPGMAITTVNVTNTCSGQTETISQMTNVQP